MKPEQINNSILGTCLSLKQANKQVGGAILSTCLSVCLPLPACTSPINAQASALLRFLPGQFKNSSSQLMAAQPPPLTSMWIAEASCCYQSCTIVSALKAAAKLLPMFCRLIIGKDKVRSTPFGFSSGLRNFWGSEHWRFASACRSFEELLFRHSACIAYRGYLTP